MVNKEDYVLIKVESFKSINSSGRHGELHIRPLPGQHPFVPTLYVRCSKELSENYPEATRFLISAKITSKLGGTPFIHSPYTWPYTVLKE